MMSMRRQLLRWLLAGQLLAVILSAGLTFFYVRAELAQLYDERLQILAYSVPASGEPLPPLLKNLPDKDDDFVIQVWKTDGTLFVQINQQEGAPELAVDGYSTHFSSAMAWRSFVLRRTDDLVQVSQPYSDRLEGITDIALGAIAPATVLVIVLSGLAWFSVGLGLRPLQVLARALSQRKINTTAPIVVTDYPAEITPLIAALNDLFQRLNQALDAQRKFIADAAHALRTPLTAVQLQHQLLHRVTSDEEKQRVIEQIQSGIKRAIHLVHQLLTFSRMAPEDWQPSMAVVDLQALIKSVVAEQFPVAQLKNIDLGIRQSQRVNLMGDKESLKIMLNNLLDNAIHYTPCGGRVDVALSQQNNIAQLDVEDNGPGIPPAERHQVFERFYRRPATRGQGNGLGLAIVAEIVQCHQGEIILTDAEHLTGLKVMVKLPLEAIF